MKRQFFTLLAGLLCLSGSVAQAAKVDTLSVRSNAMNKNVTVLTVRPDIPDHYFLWKADFSA